jgi:fibro-slime domain-containing protein
MTIRRKFELFGLGAVAVSAVHGCGAKSARTTSGGDETSHHAGAAGARSAGGAPAVSGAGGIAPTAASAGRNGRGGVTGASGTRASDAGEGGASVNPGSGGEAGAALGGEAGSVSEAGMGPAGAGPITRCGDGRLEAGEECDDGNHTSGDGCSANCRVEPAYACSTPTCAADGSGCSLHLPATFRDFNSGSATGGHPDFQPGYNSPGATLGLLEDQLDSDGKPVLSSTLSTASLTAGFMHGQAAFAQWYRDAPPSSGPIAGEIVLWNDGTGRYVNRFGKNGEQWRGQLTSQLYGTIKAGLTAGMGCSSPDEPGLGCTPGPGQACYDPCVPWNSSSQACCADVPDPASYSYDGDPLFFPIDAAPGILNEPRSEAKVPSQYGWNGLPWESEVAVTLGITTPIETATAPFPSTNHNFSFTTEVTYWFHYDASRSLHFEVGGDDDVWLFVNGRLAVDLGGWHQPLRGTLTIDDTNVSAVSQVTENDDGTTKTQHTFTDTTQSFGLVDGGVYPIKIFHAERETLGSAFLFAASGLDSTASLCVPLHP